MQVNPCSSTHSKNIAIPVAFTVQFRARGVLSKRGEARMRSKPSVFTVAMFLALVSSTLCLHVAKGQEAAAPGPTARKTKTKIPPESPALARQMNVRAKVKLKIPTAPDGHVISARPIG